MEYQNPNIRDTLGRSLQDLRISVTDRCNFRCVYCMPKEVFGANYSYLKRSELLTYEEIERLVRILIGFGVSKVRLTGGEPLLRHDLECLIDLLGCIPNIDLTLTTNASLLTLEKARSLKQAGLQRITVSLDSLDDSVFASLNDVDFHVASVLEGIDNAAAVRIAPIKINMVVVRSVNLDSILPMARYFHGRGHILRFIEYMDVGATNGWRLREVVPAAEIISMIDAEMPLKPLSPHYPGEVAKRWGYQDGGGEIGVVSSVSQPFCSNCTRLRLSAQGKIYTCLFASQGYDLRPLLRNLASDDEISKEIASVWRDRDDRYSELRTSETSELGKVEMSYIGG